MESNGNQTDREVLIAMFERAGIEYHEHDPEWISVHYVSFAFFKDGSLIMVDGYE